MAEMQGTATRGDTTGSEWRWGKIMLRRRRGEGILLFVPGLAQPIEITHESANAVPILVRAPLSVAIVRSELVCLIGGGR